MLRREQVMSIYWEHWIPRFTTAHSFVFLQAGGIK